MEAIKGNCRHAPDHCLGALKMLQSKIYNFLIGCPLPRRLCIGALALSKTKHTGPSNCWLFYYFLLQQFQRRPLKIPWRSIGVACLLLAMGTTLLTIGALLVSGHIDNKHSDRMWPVLILGMLLFIPGFYHVRLALYAFRGYRGYSFEDIPDYDDWSLRWTMIC